MLPAAAFAPLALTLDYSSLATGIAALIASASIAAIRWQRTARRLTRFVSPSVAAMVRDGGEAAMNTDVEREISVICADIRNYTAFTATLSASDVMRFLREYYHAVGQVVTAHRATIKDYAGDGILVLVGATEAQDDHARRALALAADMRAAALRVTARWATP
ncbi:MAG: adenylate/guanylate cyclase domain-containing protein, partial [Pseudomonadota bacterium]